MTEAATKVRNQRRVVQGLVSSDKADKTIVVTVQRQVKHPKYGKFIKRSSKYHAHDENNDAKQGDLVEIAECRPMSKTKVWRLVKVVNRAE
ncbi:MAG: 30S ribosomal protein S17 [Planctomycetota bacterium]|jgi:small subunit ribosomal protein S17